MTQDYDVSTRSAYQGSKVDDYKRHTQGLRWARFTMWREVGIVERAMRNFDLRHGEVMLDAPCGTGITAGIMDGNARMVVGLDISRDMMAEARKEYSAATVAGLVQGDLTCLPLVDRAVAGTVVLGFMHRVPPGVRSDSIREIYRVTQRFAAISFTVDSVAQRMKRRAVRLLRPDHQFAPSPLPMQGVLDLCRTAGFRVCRAEHVLRPLSGEVVLWLEKVEAKAA